MIRQFYASMQWFNPEFWSNEKEYGNEDIRVMAYFDAIVVGVV